METLHDIGARHGTDKATKHGYCETYARYFEPMRESFGKVLEVGIASGASLRMWSEYFPRAIVVGIDHNEEFVKTDDRWPKIHAFKMDATQRETWMKLRSMYGLFDLIVDDGFHTTANIIQTFQLAFHLLRDGGWYVVEDLHASYLRDYNRDNRLLGEIFKEVGHFDNATEYFARLVHLRVNELGLGQTGQRSMKGDIESIHFHKSLALIKRG